MFSDLLQALINADKGLFLLINGVHNEFFDGVMVAISKTKTWIPLFLLMLVGLFWEKGWRGLITLAFLGLVILMADQLSVHAFKDVFMRLRPCHDPDLRVMVHTVNGKCGGMFGFVSSHASNAFALVSFYLFSITRYRKVWGIILPFYAILVCYSRIYLGVHFPADVVGGAIVGAGIGLSLGFFEQKLMSSRLLSRKRIAEQQAE